MSTNPRKSLGDTPSNVGGRRKSRVQIEREQGLFPAPSSISRQSRPGFEPPPPPPPVPSGGQQGRKSIQGWDQQGQGQGYSQNQPGRRSGQGQQNPGGSGGGQGPRPHNPVRESTDLSLASFCASTVHIPPDLPDILKEYAKWAMRTDPPDLLAWSGQYFRALANGQPLPVRQNPPPQ